jgi:pSer/pThr/pTyr-binding forkhead associated (FHA) protein
MLLDNFGSCVSLELLDAENARPLQAWTFESADVVTIGRSPEHSVMIADPRVSRLHAELRYEVGGWHVKSLGRNGVLLDGQKIESAPLAHRSLLRLGTTGPLLRFSIGRPLPPSGATMCEESGSATKFTIDESQKQTDVELIAQGDYFRQLKERADELRKQRRT